MQVGDRVIYYTHEASDVAHGTTDRVALVLSVIDDRCLDLVVFPPGGPLLWERVCKFDPNGFHDVVGLSYWRPVGEAPPQLGDAFAYANDPLWIDMVRRHEDQWARAKGRNASDAELKDLEAQQLRERKDLRGRLEKEKPLKKEPAPAPRKVP